MFEPQGANKDVYLLAYKWRKQEYKEDKPILDELIKEGLVTIVEKDLKTILFRYHAPKQGGKRKGEIPSRAMDESPPQRQKTRVEPMSQSHHEVASSAWAIAGGKR